MPDVSGTAAPVPQGSRYVVAAYGYDDVTLGFDLSGSAVSLKRVAEMPGREFGTTKRLGYDGAWGKFENLLGRSYATFKRDTNVSTFSGSR